MENTKKVVPKLFEDDKKHKPHNRRLSAVWRILRPISIVIISITVVVSSIYFAVNYFIKKYLDPIDINDATPIAVTVPTGYGASAIAKLLYEACGVDEVGLISNKAVFKVYVDFLGKSSNLQAGTYILAKNMDLEQIVDELCKGNPPQKTVRITIIEGNTVNDIATKLFSQGVIASRDEFLQLCKKGEKFTDYSFIKDIPVNPQQDRDFALEGYLFPDTYDFYVNSPSEAVIDKILMRFFEVYTDEYIAKTKELNRSIDDIIKMASLVEKEARLKSDFPKVAAVFYNRLKENMTLDTDAAIQYIYKTNKLEYTSEELNNPSLYNTHKYKGLPLGPISNPGLTALLAALYPEQSYIDEGYQYFCLKDPKTGELVFAKTLKEHNDNVDRYSPLWTD